MPDRAGPGNPEPAQALQGMKSAASEPVKAPAPRTRDAQRQEGSEENEGQLTASLSEELELVCKTKSDDKIDDENGRSEPSPKPKNDKQSANHFCQQHEKQAWNGTNMERVSKVSRHTVEVHRLV